MLERLSAGTIDPNLARSSQRMSRDSQATSAAILLEEPSIIFDEITVATDVAKVPLSGISWMTVLRAMEAMSLWFSFLLDRTLSQRDLTRKSDSVSCTFFTIKPKLRERRESEESVFHDAW